MKKRHYFYQAALCLAAISLTSVSCDNKDTTEPDTPGSGGKEPAEITIPSIQTIEVSEITDKSAKSGGKITSDGGSDVLQKGVVWDIEKNPTIELPTLTKEGVGSDDFTSTLENLEAETTYYYRAYATNSAGTAYGEEKSFTTGQASALSVKVGNLTMEFILVEGGTFQMGATAEQIDYIRNEDELPVHSVTLDSYYIGKYEVTQDVWVEVMGNNPSMVKGDRRSVENLNWEIAYEFVQKISEKTGLKFALPTEAQWEYAARGGKYAKNFLFSGSDDASEVGWFVIDNVRGAQEVGQKKPNELGIYDMSGNVWEWCQDWFGKYTEEAQTNPTGPANGTDKVMRGGSWICTPEDMGRVSRRLIDYPQVPRMDNGVRLVYIP